MKKLLALILLASTFSCGQSNEKKKEDVVFFQVKQFIEKELEDLKKTPYFIYKIELRDTVRDSTIIPVDSVIYYSQPFVHPDINDEELKDEYEESVFHDQTTGSFSLSYSTPNKDLDVQNVNVLLHEDGETVKRIFIRKYLEDNDQSVIEQLDWKPNESFEINRLITLPGGHEKTHRTIIVWNPKVKE
jgi:hypothetical protein